MYSNVLIATCKSNSAGMKSQKTGQILNPWREMLKILQWWLTGNVSLKLFGLGYPLF